MRDFDYKLIAKQVIDEEIIGLLNTIYEYKGKHDFLIDNYSEKIETYIESAKILYFNSLIKGWSPRGIIEWVNGRHLSVDEEVYAELWVGLRLALKGKDLTCLKVERFSEIFSYKETFLGFNNLFRNDKNFSCYVGEEYVTYSYVPVEKKFKNDYLNKTENEFKRAFFDEKINPLILVSLYLFDIYHIYPWNDGEILFFVLNFLVSCGFQSVKYASILTLLKEQYASFIKSFECSSVDWETGKNDYKPFVKFLLNLMIELYEEIDMKIIPLCTCSKISKADKVTHSILTYNRDFTKSEIRLLCPDVSESTVENILVRLTEEKKIYQKGSGRGSYYSFER